MGHSNPIETTNSAFSPHPNLKNEVDGSFGAGFHLPGFGIGGGLPSRQRLPESRRMRRV